ncbi:MAG TPA: bifunctional protein-serine/threonine kinase/phosphatase [Porticoccus sp.]|nr:bifunctional protein-serine/threonine kinase/phosphatase [Porticoccus sp.]
MSAESVSVESTRVDSQHQALPSELRVTFGGHSIAGIKKKNEDAFAAYLPSSKGVNQLKGITACIADGVSCSENAQLASQTAITHFIDDYYSTPESWTVQTSAARVLSSLNAWLYHHGRQDYQPQNGAVTTLSATIFKSRTAHLFHAGDSRIYRLRNGELEQLSTDHCNHGSGGKTYLTRALGMDSHLEVDYIQTELEQGDLFLLTTDGVHDVLTRNDLASLIKSSTARPSTNQPTEIHSTENTLEDIAATIVDRALSKGSEDNLSCLLVRIEELPMEDINDLHRKLTHKTIPPVMEPGMNIDNYTVQQVLYSGTRSHLYLVTHPDHSNRLVLKAPSVNFAEDAQYLEGFMREEWAGRRIDNKGVMKILPQDDKSKFLYHLCEYIDGQTLRQWMYDNPQPSLEKVRAISQGIIQSLRAFQRLGMVHRDLKPENVIIDKNEQIKLIDFGTVQVSGLNEISSPLNEEFPVGSVDYIAPEYLMGQRGTYRSDLFSLGVIIYEMLSGKQPFNLSNTHRRTPKHFGEWQYHSAQEYRSDIPLWLDLALEKATNPNPTGRYSALSEFYADLCTPNKIMVNKREQSPLLERNPVRLWKMVSALLLIIVVLQAAL